MPGLVSAEIELYAERHSTAPGEDLDLLAAQTREQLRSPAMLSGAVEGRLLELLVFASGARMVLELGTYSGYSALSMAAALPPDGRIVTCEVNPEHAEFARRHIARSPFAARIEVRLGPALDTVTELDGPFDLVFIDADKPSYRDYYEAVLAKLAERGVIVVDNTLWSGRVLDPDGADEATRALAEFNDFVRGDKRVVCVMLTVRDGITLIRRAR
ncbi:MAG: class I SAM-dependent methyltransferase [Thermoleophilaceae bacterium]